MNKSPEHNHQQVTQQVVTEKYSSTSHSKKRSTSQTKNKSPEKNHHQQVTRQVSQQVSQQTSSRLITTIQKKLKQFLRFPKWFFYVSPSLCNCTFFTKFAILQVLGFQPTNTHTTLSADFFTHCDSKTAPWRLVVRR